MGRENLHDTLARLHAELENAGAIDADLRTELERAIEEIREVVERRRPAEAPLGDRLEALALRFEQSHPLLTQALGGVVRALGAMGI
jgi:hypothetical protein